MGLRTSSLMPGIGSRRHLVSLQNPGPAVPDGDGGYTQKWTDLDPATLYVSIEPATNRDQVAYGTVVSWATHIVKGQFHPQVNTGTRVLFNGRRFDVAGVQNIEERSIRMELSCVEKAL